MLESKIVIWASVLTHEYIFWYLHYYVSLFIQRTADIRKCVALNESHARTWFVDEDEGARE